MMTYLRNGFLTLAFSILMVHSVIPHQHADNNGLLYTNANALEIKFLDLIKVVLSEDLGANHLEEYLGSTGSGSYELSLIIILQGMNFSFVSSPSVIPSTVIDYSINSNDWISEPDRTRGSPATV